MNRPVIVTDLHLTKMEKTSLFKCYYQTPTVVVSESQLKEESVWRVVADFEHYAKWNSVCTIELLGPLQIGTDILIHVIYPGLELTSHETISLLQEPRRIGWAYKGLVARLGLVKTQRNINIHFDPETRRLAVNGEITFAGPIARLAWYLKGKGVKEMLSQFNDDLARRVNSLLLPTSADSVKHCIVTAV